MNWYIFIAAVAAAVLIEAYLCYRIVFRSPLGTQNDFFNIPKEEQYSAKREIMLKMITELSETPFEQVYIKSKDGLTLAARYYEAAKDAPLAICFHGYRGTGIRDFSGGAKSCIIMGQNLLLVDQRAQGLSAGHTITFGIKEKQDCLDWIDYGLQRFGKKTKIVLYGISMGAATVLFAAGEKLPENVRAVIADSPYSSVKGIIRKVCRDMRLHIFPVCVFVELGARLFAHIDLAEGEVPAAIEKAKVPILIIHGEDDRFVPCEMSKAMAAQFPEKLRLETFPNAGHGISFMEDESRYEETVRAFLKDCGV